jgi:hypothetical protein
MSLPRSKVFSSDGHSSFVSLVPANSCFPHSRSETPNTMCWNTYWYLKQSECQFIPGPTDGGTEFNITSSLVRGRLRQAPTTVDPSSAMTQQPLRNCVVAYSRNSRSLFPVVHGGKQCARGSSRRKIFVTWSSTSWWRFSGTTWSEMFPNCDLKVQNYPKQHTKLKTCHVARIQTGVLLWLYLSQ